MSTTVNPVGVANASGYPLEAAIESIAKKWEAATHWYVIGREHPWKRPDADETRFIDLVLGGQQYDTVDHSLYRRRLVVECKRLDGTWVFPVSVRDTALSNDLRTVGGNPRRSPSPFWCSVGCGPPAYRADSCALSTKRGATADASDRRTLEAWSSELVLAAFALFAQERSALADTSSPIAAALYIPVIVTTAALSVLVFDPEKVDLASGYVASPPDSVVHEVDWVRFSKDLGFEALGPDPLSPAINEVRASQGAWVVRATEFLRFLQESLSIRVRPGA